jgi:hypothetical protein
MNASRDTIAAEPTVRSVATRVTLHTKGWCGLVLWRLRDASAHDALILPGENARSGDLQLKTAHFRR